MSNEIQYTPIATVEVANDGTCTLVIDWGSSEQGEYDPETGNHEPSALSEVVGNLLDSWVKSNGGESGEQRIEIGKLGRPLNLMVSRT